MSIHHVRALEKLVAELEANPAKLHEPELGFFKAYLLKLGAKIPDPPKQDHAHDHAHAEKSDHGHAHDGCCGHKKGCAHDHGKASSHDHEHAHDHADHDDHDDDDDIFL